MSDPTYEYVKGKGWIPIDYSPDCDIVYYESGEKARIEYRKPNKGERGTWHNVNWTREQWKEWALGWSSPRNINACTGRESPERLVNGPVWWITVVPL